MLPKQLEQHLGEMVAANKRTRAQAELPVCPPVPAQLLAHLEQMFSEPDKTARPNNPVLGQLLIVQYGCNKVLNYLRAHYENQSRAARKGRTV